MSKPRDTVSAYCFSAPALVLLMFVLVLPAFLGLRMSFFQWQLSALRTQPVFVGFENYRELFSSIHFWASVRTTLVFTLSVVVLEVVLGLALALVLEHGVPGLRFFRTVFVLPMMIAPVVVGVLWGFLYHPQFGKINYALQAFELGPVLWLANPRLALLSVILTDVWQWTPFVFLVLLAGLQGIPQHLLYAAKVDGANYMQTLLHIKIPHIAPVLGIATVLRLIDSFRGLVVIMTLTNGGPGVATEILPLNLQRIAFEDHRLGKASAVAVLLFLLTSLLTCIFILLTMRRQAR